MSIANLLEDSRKADGRAVRLLALMTGSGDPHLENLGLLGGFDRARLAPVFDPAPMRAWRRHNIQMAIPIDFKPRAPVYRKITRQDTAFGFQSKLAT